MILSGVVRRHFLLPAVNHHGTSIDRIRGCHLPHEMQKWTGVIGHSMVRPDGEVILPHDPLLFGALFLEGEGADSVLSQGQDILNLDAN